MDNLSRFQPSATNKNDMQKNPTKKQCSSLFPRYRVGFVEAPGTIFNLKPIPSMYGIFTYIWLIFMVNVGKYTIHGWYGKGRLFFVARDDLFVGWLSPLFGDDWMIENSTCLMFLVV